MSKKQPKKLSVKVGRKALATMSVRELGLVSGGLPPVFQPSPPPTASGGG